MRKHRPLIVVAVLLLALALFGAVTGASSHRPHPHPHPTPSPTQTVTPTPTPTPTVTVTPDGSFNGGPAVPTGYTQRYAHNFATTPGFGDWVVQPGAGAQVVSSTQAGAEFGLGVRMSSTNQWAELISSNAVVTADTFIKALVYIPAGSGSRPDGAQFPVGSTANWPAFWDTGNPWPANGEIDILEGRTGRSCLGTLYGTNGLQQSPSFCGPVNSTNGGVSTGWITITLLRTGQQAQVWYGNTFIGTAPMPTNANQKLIFQNQSYSTSVCGNCFGPTLLGTASTAWLSRVTVWSK